MKRYIDAIPDLSLGASGGFLTYQTPKKQFGEFVVIRKGDRIEENQAYATIDNFKHQGFEAVELVLSKTRNPQLADDARVVVKDARPMSLLLSIADGHDDSLLDVYLQPGIGSKMDPKDLTPQETASLRTWILASCRILDLYDLNNNRTSPDVALGSRPAPGKAWWRQYCQGRSGTESRTLLGYNHPTLAIFVVHAVEKYGPELQRLTGKLSVQEREQLEVYAWLSANRKAAETVSGCYAGCAWDEKYYYYLAIDVPIYPVETADSKSKRRALGFFRVLITDGDGGNSSISPSPTGIPDGAEQIFIPGWDDEVVE